MPSARIELALSVCNTVLLPLQQVGKCTPSKNWTSIYSSAKSRSIRYTNGVLVLAVYPKSPVHRPPWTFTAWELPKNALILCTSSKNWTRILCFEGTSSVHWTIDVGGFLFNPVILVRTVVLVRKCIASLKVSLMHQKSLAILVSLAGFEPATNNLKGCCYNH